ncbi:hypothetical protein IFM89_014522 [Coptis chinensis]|uniref:DUF3444 domain-containing protein n=1 Tax=Coptis chinensis TaxID=261450 RepID=A0A835HF19_9MAGN|nr:hypothetical protein IFM89_014522 [Coptis chinensis]
MLVCSIDAYKYICYVFLQVLSLLRSFCVHRVRERLGFVEMFGMQNRRRRGSRMSWHHPNSQFQAIGTSNQSSCHKPRRKRRLSNEGFGRLSLFQIPPACASIINQLNRELGHTSEVETMECKYALYSVWALSDNIDGMPRLYARIHRIIREELEIEVALLEPLTAAHEEKQWVVDKNLPMVCGIFKEMNSKTIVKVTAFSHKVTSKAPRWPLYDIFPHRGEIWALFKDWELNWTLHDLNSHTQYEIVEVLSDKPDCTIVVSLVRVEGFEAVFQRQVQVQEKSRRFSQKNCCSSLIVFQLPKSKVEERDGVPSGLWMLESLANQHYSLSYFKLLPG